MAPRRFVLHLPPRSLLLRLRAAFSWSPSPALLALALAACTTCASFASEARAQESAQPGAPGKQEVAPPAAVPTSEPASPASAEVSRPRNPADERDDSVNPFRNSILLFDQSMTTQTAGIGNTPLSYVPLYELWLSFRPRYYFDEHWSVRGRFDLTKELTNAQATTNRNEDVFGDIWTDLVYSAKLDRWWPDTKASIGVRALWPTSKVSQANGTYVTLGLRGGAEHRVQIHGDGAPWLNHFLVGFIAAYLHPFTTATTASSYGNFGYVRQNVDGFSFISPEINAQPLVQHEFWTVLNTALQITPRLELRGDLIAINQWHYAPTPNVNVPISGGSTIVQDPRNDNRFTENTWVTAEVGYDLLDELSLSLGYYNLANAVAPNGQARSLFGSDTIWWSPDARIFFDVTANLDALFDDANGHKYSGSQAQARHRDRIASHLR